MQAEGVIASYEPEIQPALQIRLPKFGGLLCKVSRQGTLHFMGRSTVCDVAEGIGDVWPLLIRLTKQAIVGRTQFGQFVIDSNTIDEAIRHVDQGNPAHSLGNGIALFLLSIYTLTLSQYFVEIPYRYLNSLVSHQIRIYTDREIILFQWFGRPITWSSLFI